MLELLEIAAVIWKLRTGNAMGKFHIKLLELAAVKGSMVLYTGRKTSFKLTHCPFLGVKHNNQDGWCCTA